MAILRIEKLNEVYIRIFTEPSVEADLSEFFKFEVPGAKFTPKYKARLWDGLIRLYDLHRKTLYYGLLPYVQKFAEDNDHTIELLSDFQEGEQIDYGQVKTFAESLLLHGRGQPIAIRDYQLDAIHTGLNSRRTVLLSPTGSGKSLIIYTLCRWLLEKDKKIIIVVPTTSLVEQMYDDFKDYSTINQWSVDDHCHRLYSGLPKLFSKHILFTTWQSVYKQPGSWFNQFDAIVGDEAHLFKAKSLTSIMEKMTDTQYRIGTTGSLDNKAVHHLVLQGVFGAIHRVTTTKELQDSGTLAPLKIKAILLKHSDQDRKECEKLEYQGEVKLIINNEKRNKFIRNLSISCKGNTLILFSFVETHGAVLHSMIQAKAGDRPVYFIHGGTDVEDREAVRKALDTENDAIIVASFGVFSTGINIPSIENIIFASPTKSMTRVLQSIGRGLRMSEGKTHCKLYDLTDDLHTSKWKNLTLKHGFERFKIYTNEGFDIKMTEVVL